MGDRLMWAEREAPAIVVSSRVGPRVIAVRLGALSGLVLLGYAVAQLVVWVVVDGDAVRGWVESSGRSALNRPVAVRRVTARVFPVPHVVVFEPRVTGPAGTHHPVLFEASRATARLSVRALLAGRVELGDVRVDGPIVRLAVDSAGRSNFGDLIPEVVHDHSPRRRVRVATDRVSFGPGRLEFTDARDGTELRLAGVGIDATRALPWGGEHFWVTVSADSVSVAGVGRRRHFGDLSARADLVVEPRWPPDWLEIRNGSLRMEGAAMALAGRLDALHATVREVWLGGSIDRTSDGAPATWRDAPGAALAPDSGEDVLVDMAFRVEGQLGGGARPTLTRTLGAVHPDAEPETGDGWPEVDDVRLVDLFVWLVSTMADLRGHE